MHYGIMGNRRKHGIWAPPYDSEWLSRTRGGQIILAPPYDSQFRVAGMRSKSIATGS